MEYDNRSNKAGRESNRAFSRSREKNTGPQKSPVSFSTGVVVGLCCLLLLSWALANPPREDSVGHGAGKQDSAVTKPRERKTSRLRKEIDVPNAKDFSKARKRRSLIEQADKQAAAKQKLSPTLQAELQALARAGEDRVLVILVEFAGKDTFEWDPNSSTWDPIGKCDTTEYTGNPSDIGTTYALQNIIAKYGLTTPRKFTYAGPLHNQIPRPVSAEDRSGDMIWTEDFSPNFYRGIIDGDGVTFKYKREDGSEVNLDFTGKSVSHYMEDMSGGKYTFNADIIGWLPLEHSIWWYGTDPAPGARSGYSVSHHGGIPGAGNARSLVRDALDAVNAISGTIPGFDWSNYDQDKDGIIDRLWIIHAGLGEEDSTTILNRTDYGEATLWSHSSALSPPYTVYSNGLTIAAGPYIMMPENCGIAVLAHEYSHNLGADDLYAYGEGQTSAGFWTLMADDWTGYPIGFEPPALDPWHLDNWGWLDPLVITDPTKVYTVNLGQASDFPGGKDIYRGVRIPLTDQEEPLPVQPNGNYYWYGGQEDLTYGGMKLKDPVTLPKSGATLSFMAAWDIEEEWDFLWVQISADGGTTWNTLTNEHTVDSHDPSWIGGEFGFPDDLAAAGIGGFTGYNENFPDKQLEAFDLTPYAGEKILLRIWYMTDWGTVYAGPFLDDIVIQSGSTVLFASDAESEKDIWEYTAPWSRNNGTMKYSHNYYLQWRNVSETGGYDRCLSVPQWRFGPANTGLLVWYNNNKYSDNEVFNYVADPPGFGPKGRMLVVDAHPEPYRDPYWVEYGYPNEGANVDHRSLMRDAPFSREDCVDFTMPAGYVNDPSTVFKGYPAAPHFCDYWGYYPGAEYVSRGPGYDPPSYKWITRHWDASVVIPSTQFYGLKAPGYMGDQEFRFDVRRYLPTGRLSAYWYPEGLGYDGGTGNPGVVGGNHGWNVRVIEQKDTSAVVEIWNSHYTTRDAGAWAIH
jgi:immune inhibitor A